MRDFFNFKTLITEKIIKWIYIILVALAGILTVFAIFGSWVQAFSFMRRAGLGVPVMFQLIIRPILIILVAALYMIILRMAFEATLVRFLIYRELKELNDKTEK